ncbi:MAG: hypothetical protein ACLTW9_03775 [Enterocloster sp.]
MKRYIMVTFGLKCIWESYQRCADTVTYDGIAFSTSLSYTCFGFVWSYYAEAIGLAVPEGRRSFECMLETLKKRKFFPMGPIKDFG